MSPDRIRVALCGNKFFTEEFELIVVEQNRVRQNNFGCLRYPESELQEKKQQAAKRVKQQVADPALFMAMVIKQRSAPPTEVVAKGQSNRRFSFGFPVVIKPLDGRKMILAKNQNEVNLHTKGLKGTGYQIQMYLQGYKFLKVRVENGVIEEGHPSYVCGAVRRLVTLLTAQGVYDFTLTVATNNVTTYIIGARLS